MSSKRMHPYSRSKRPVDKKIVCIAKSAIGTQVATNIFSATKACTISSLRLALSFTAGSALTTQKISWAVIHLRDGSSAGGFTVTDGNALYAPEQDVMLYGSRFAIELIGNTTADSNTGTPIVEQVTTTQRKLKAGDFLQFIVMGSAANAANLHGTCQFFVKE